MLSRGNNRDSWQRCFLQDQAPGAFYRYLIASIWALLRNKGPESPVPIVVALKLPL
jgi:hypothetical protein